MTTSSGSEAGPGSLAELFHQVGQLVPEGQRLVMAPPNMTVAEALRLMSDYNYSQLPVVAGKTVLGVFSYRSLAQRLLGLRQMPEDIGRLPVDEFMEQFQFVQPSDNWESILKHLDRKDGVLVGHRELLRGILTPMDVLGYLHRIASPFVMLAEIELSLRRIITACVSQEELQTCIRNSLAQKYGEEGLPVELSEMTFADYVQIIGDGRNWPHFTTVFGEGEWQRKTTAVRLRQVGNLRNEVFHFRREMASQDLENLSARRDWLQMKARAFEGVKAERAVPEKRKEPKLSTTEELTRRKWDEPSFLGHLQEQRGAEEVAATRQIFDWSKAKRLVLRWGHGKDVGTCYVSLKKQAGHTLFGLWSNGYVELHLGYLKRFPPFDSAQKLSEWMERLNVIPGIRVTDTETGQFPHFPLIALTNQVALERFLKTVDWVLAEIERASASELVPLQVATALDPAAAERLQRFLGSLLRLGFIREEGSIEDAYKAQLLYQFRDWNEHRPHPVTVLYLAKKGTDPGLRFRIDMLSVVKDLNVDDLQAKLLAAGCTPANRSTTPVELLLTKRNDQATFDRLHEILADLLRKHQVT